MRCDGFAFAYVCMCATCVSVSIDVRRGHWIPWNWSVTNGCQPLVGFLELTQILCKSIPTQVLKHWAISSVIETIFHCFIIFTCSKPKSMQRLKYYRIFSWMECFKINILDQQDNSLPRGYGGTWAPKSSPNGVKPRRNTHGTLLWVAPEPVPHHFSSYLVNENVVTWPGMLRNLVYDGVD